MSSKSGSKSSTPTAKTRPSLKIKLKVPPEILARFSNLKSTTESSKTSSPAPVTKTTSPVEDVKDENENEKSETNGVQTNNDDDKKKVDTVKNGLKRDASTLGAATAPKSRSRPGPKRRRMYVSIQYTGRGISKLTKYSETEDQQPWTITMTGPGTHKLGPKANQGAINAGLRALDRSGNPCRKWGRKAFDLKTFNGSEWSLHHWRAPPKVQVKADGVENETPSTNSENNQPSSNVPSISSHQAGDMKDVAVTAAAESSPGIIAASA